MIRLTGAGLVALAAVLLVGCQAPKMETEPPQRPAELDRLDTFAGTWEDTAEIKMAGSDEVMTSKGVETVSWEADRWLLVSHYEYEMGDEGLVKGLSVMTWDPKAEKYRSWSFNNLGKCGMGAATYDEAAKTWHFKGKSRNALTGEARVGKGWSKVIDGNTQEWSWTEWDRWGLRKLMEINGSTHRK